MVEYTQITAATLTQALHDQDKLGQITKALLPIQCATMGGTALGDLPHKATQHMTIIRQLHI